MTRQNDARENKNEMKSTENIQGFVSLYRRYLPKRKEFNETYTTASKDPSLKKFLDEYLNGYYDWGDDPSFFSAQEFMGNVCYATWGVCRHDLRPKLKKGDLVIYFCGKPHISNCNLWDYYYIGFGTVRETIDRFQLWSEDQFEPFRKFYNVLAKPEGSRLVQDETFYPFHKDWEKRAKAPLILFETDTSLSQFNLTNPLHVATYDGLEIPEKWDSDDSTVAKLESLLFKERNSPRRLRTSRTGFAHRHVNLTRPKSTSRSMRELREALFGLSNEITCKQI